MRIACLPLLLLAPFASAIEPRDLQGLEVTVERIGEPVVVDGVSMHIQRVQGNDVAQLAGRIEQRWRKEGGNLRHMQQQGWQMLGRWQGGRSDLVQWRGEGRDAQLLYSRLDTLQQPLRQSAPPFALPSGCAWGRVVEGESPGGRYQQRSAICRGYAADVQPALRATLRAQGWMLRGETAAAIELGSGGVQGTLTVVPGRYFGESALVWIGVLTNAGKRE